MNDDDDKLLKMYKAVHGKPCRTKFTLKVTFAEDDSECEHPLIALMSEGRVQWTVSREQVIFDYLTKDWG